LASPINTIERPERRRPAEIRRLAPKRVEIFPQRRTATRYPIKFEVLIRPISEYERCRALPMEGSIMPRANRPRPRLANMERVPAAITYQP
jgi:hypothetical protein